MTVESEAPISDLDAIVLDARAAALVELNHAIDNISEWVAEG
jgi:hypothetical protein